MLSLDQRKMVLRWHDEGKNQQAIADLVGCHQTSVGRLIAKYTSKGIIEDLPRSGRPTPLKKETLSRLKEVLKERILQKNAKFGSLTTKELRQIIQQEIGKLYSPRHVERIMHTLGFSLITPRTMHTKHDQEAVDNFRDEFKKKLNQSIWVMKSSQSTK